MNKTALIFACLCALRAGPATGATLEEDFLALSVQARDASRLRDLNARLFAAASTCDEKGAQALITQGAVPALALQGETFAAEAAAACETPGTLHVLLAHGAAVNSPAYRESPFRRALRADREPTVELLLSMKTDPTDGLAAALARGDELLARYFLKAGADATGRTHGEGLLKAALDGNLNELAAELLRRGADANDGAPLGQAIRGDSPDQKLIHALLTAGANPNEESIDFLPPREEASDAPFGFRGKFAGLRSLSMLQMAAARCQPAVVADLLSHGASRLVGAEDESPAELVRRTIARGEVPADACRRTLEMLD